MAHGASLELAKIEPPTWRTVTAAKLAEAKAARWEKKQVSKKRRNVFYRRYLMFDNTMTKSDSNKTLREIMRVQSPSK